MAITWRANPLGTQISEAIRNVDVPEDILFIVHPNGTVSVRYRDGDVQCVLRNWEESPNTLTWRAMAYPPAKYSQGTHFDGRGVPITGSSAEEVLKIAAMSARMGVFDGY